MPTDTLLQAAGVLSLADVVRFQYFHIIRKLWPIVLLTFLALLLGLFGIFAVLTTGDHERWKNPGLYWAIQALWALLMLTGPYWGARWQHTQQPYLRGPMRYHFTADMIRLEGAQFSNEITWPLMRGIYETKTLFVLYQSPWMAWILPKRFFWQNERLVQQWRDWAIQQLPERKRFHGPGLLTGWL